MRKVFYLVAASLLMTSCLEDKIIEEYNEDFVSVFGNADPLHTWKMVDSKSVEVNLDKSARVKIYVLVDDTYRLAADYENVSGTQTLSFDAPMGCEDIYVTVDGVPYQGINARNVEQNVVPAPVVNVDGELNITYGDVYKFHTEKYLDERVDNRGKVNATGCKFKSKGTGTYLFYPIYWGGIFKHRYGLYYYDGDGKIQVCEHFYINKEDENSLKYLNEKGEYVPVKQDYVKDLFTFPSKDKLTQADLDKVVLKSPCFKFQIEPETVFGFYVDIYWADGSYKTRYYSDPELNKVTSTDNKPFAAFAYMHNEGESNVSYITIEDYKNDDNDYNDFIFMMTGSHEHFNDTPLSYIYAVEDLGGTNDFDFNDVVFSVSHVSGKENATVQPLAAGGIYPANICFEGIPYGYGANKEIHDMFGVKTNVMVNTASGTTKGSMKKADPFLVPVGANWSNTATSYGNSGNGFSVRVTIPDKPQDKVLEVSTSKPGGKDSAPQMLVLSGDWLWPTEKTSIAVAYPKFAEWVQKFEEGNDTWDDNPAGPVVNWK